jgi:hypothetical protein
MSRDRDGRIYCDCAAPVHFVTDVAKLPEGRYGENHPAGARCTYVVRADVGDALICGACDKAGHGAVRHPDAFERFNAKQSTQTAEVEPNDLWPRVTDAAIRRNQDVDAQHREA